MPLKKVPFILVSFLLLSQAYAITLNEALVLSLENDPAAIERVKNFNVIRQEVRMAASENYPQIDVYAGVGYQDISNADTGFTKSDETIYESGLILHQNLFDGFGTTYRVAAAEARTAMAAYRYVESVNTAAYHLVTQYITVLKTRELLRIATKNIKDKQMIAQEVASRYAMHHANVVSVQRSNTSLARARSHYYVVNNRYIAAQHRLKTSMGWSVSPRDLAPPKPLPEFSLNREDALQFAIQNHPAIRVADFELRVAQERYKQNQGAFLPKIDAQVRQEFNSNRNGIVGAEDDFTAMLTLSYNLYRGGADRAREQQHISRLSQLIAKRNDRKRRLMESVGLAWSDRVALGQQQKALKEYERFAEQTYRRYFQEYHTAEHDLLDLMSAHNELINAKKERTVARYDLLLAQYRMLYVTGTLLEAVLGDAEALYARVGIQRNEITSDALPLSLDADGDQYSDREDLCQNTMVSGTVNAYGCHDAGENILRENNLHVREGDTILDSQSQARVDVLIATLKQQEDTNGTITILAHTQATGNTYEDMQTSRIIAEKVKDYMVAHGINSHQIHTLAKGSSAPLWMGTSLTELPQNSRVEIVASTPKILPASMPKQLVTPLMQYETLPKRREVATVVPPIVGVALPTLAEQVKQKFTVRQTGTEEPVQQHTDEVLQGHVIILGSFHTKEDAEVFALKFHDMPMALLVLESTTRRYNLKIVCQSRSDALTLVDQVKKMIPDAWYAGTQRIHSYTVLSR